VGWMTGVQFPARVGTFSIAILVPTQRPIQWVPGVVFPGIERSGSETDHSPPSSAEVKNVWSYLSISPTLLHGVVLGRAHGNFTVTFALHRTCPSL